VTQLPFSTHEEGYRLRVGVLVRVRVRVGFVAGWGGDSVGGGRVGSGSDDSVVAAGEVLW
jgi:hypothetical protein